MRREGEEHTVRVAAGAVDLDGDLSLPEGAAALFCSLTAAAAVASARAIAT
jgi:hypothetical protein